MFSVLLVVLCFTFRAAVVAQPSLSIVCVAGQCFQGYSNTTIGATLSGPGGTPRVQLLPGQYTSTTDPLLLRNLLNFPSSTLVGSAGFRNASLSPLPLNLQLEPGVAVYSQSLYSGQALFAKLPESPVINTSIPLSARSIAIAPNVWIAVSNRNNRLILWDSVPDISQLPSIGALSLLDIQISGCSPPCSGPSVCAADGSTCTCPTGFSGSACESCADGYFGPTCEPCPEDCSDCDQGMSGSGRCLTPPDDTDNLPTNCDCLHGICEEDGKCTCNTGWATSQNGTACASCTENFFLTTAGDCQVCGLGCVKCKDNTGECASCKEGFTQDANDTTKCIGVPTQTIGPPCNRLYCSPIVPCPNGTFAQETQCSKCSPACLTCTGPTDNNCTLCAAGTYFFNGHCVATNSEGVCQGTNGLVANNAKKTCDSCGADCMSCAIPNFSSASTMDQLQCTRCLPGFFLLEGKCTTSCPTGTFASQNNTCTGCSRSCRTCEGSPGFCLTCPSGRVVSSGRCMSSCPSDTFPSSGSCIKCHPDCITCSGPSFDQCNSCPPFRPVLTDGRCLSTCSKSEYFDVATLSCRTCDSSCSSCSGPGSRKCLGCSGSSQVLRAGSCFSADCQGSSSIVLGLGVCLSDVVEVPSPSSSSSTTSESESLLPSASESLSPLPTVTSVTKPTPTPTPTSPNTKLIWWQILVMSLGCAFMFLMFIWCWGWSARKDRETRTKKFANNWFVRLGQHLFRRGRDDTQSKKSAPYFRDSFHSPKVRRIEDDEELWTTERDSLDDFVSVYGQSHTPSALTFDRHGNAGRLERRTDRNSDSLYSGRQRSPDRRLGDPVRKLPLNNLVDNRFRFADPQAYIPRIIEDTGDSSYNQQSTLSRFPTYSNLGWPKLAPHLTKSNRMPVPLTGDGYGPYMMPQPQPPLQPTVDATHSNAPPHNPFSKRDPNSSWT